MLGSFNNFRKSLRSLLNKGIFLLIDFRFYHFYIFFLNLLFFGFFEFLKLLYHKKRKIYSRSFFFVIIRYEQKVLETISFILSPSSLSICLTN